MKFLIHYIVRSPIKDLNFDFVWDGPVSARDLPDLRGVCASDATQKYNRSNPPVLRKHDIVIAGIFPIPDDSGPKQIGAS